jgi:hypothetical protein
MKDRIEILVSGFGGQGVVRLGQIVGTAAVNQGFRVTMLKSHGTEQRGGYVRTQVVLSKEEIDSPLVEDPDYFCSFSSAAYQQFGHMMKDQGYRYRKTRPSDLCQHHHAGRFEQSGRRSAGQGKYAGDHAGHYSQVS